MGHPTETGFERGRSRVGLVLALLLVGSSAADVDRRPEPGGARADRQDARVTGIVTEADGTPIEGISVRITETDTGIGQYAFGAMTLGFGCLIGACTAPSDLVDQITTGPDGRYTGTLPNSYEPGFETDEDWIVGAGVPPGDGQAVGATSSFEFEVNTPRHDAPPIPLWRAAPESSLDGYRLSAVSPQPPSGTTFSVLSVEPPGTTVEISQPDTVIDLRHHETPEGQRITPVVVRAVATADPRIEHQDGRTIYHQTVVSAGRAAEVNLVPPSRGSSCQLLDSDGTDVTGGRRCALTDGNLSFGVVTDDPGAPATSAVVALGAPIEAALVVVRECPSCSIAIDGGGGAFDSVATAMVGDLTVATLAPPRVVTRIRVVDAAELTASEVSAWPTAPPAFAADPVPGGRGRDAPDSGAGPSPPDRDDDGPGLLPWLAVGGALLVGLLAGILLSRRRNPS